MEKLSKNLISYEKWLEIKEQVKFYWLENEDLACAYYIDGNNAFLITYDLNLQSLDYYNWTDTNDRSLISKFVAYLPEFPEKNIKHLMCPQYLVELIEECLHG